MNPSRLKAVIGANIKALRERHGMNQEQLGEAIGRTWQSISLIERGKTLPPLTTLGALATTLGVAPSDLLSETGLPRSDHRADLLRQAEISLADLSDAQLETAVRMLAVLREGFRRG